MTHPELVSNLCKSGANIALELTADQAHLIHMAMGISGEAGEMLDTIKKHCIYQQPLDLGNMIEEIGDAEFYLEGLRQALGITREQTLSHNIDKLTKRYGEKYSDQAAKDRKDKQ